jgi:pimeloyl-ACP methyl ester carboxylesterase
VVTLVGIAVAAAVVWVVLTTFWMWRYQERVVFQPPMIEVEAPAPARRVEFNAADGHQLYGYLLSPPAESARPVTVVIAYHGNADLSAWLVPWASELADRAGVTVFLPEYRGYGGITGSPTYASASSDALGALEFARSKLQPARIVLFGHSLGTAVASDVAATMTAGPPSALVLQSPFTSARDMAARMLVPPIPWVWRRISRVHYDTRALVAGMDAPVWVAHGTADVVIPARMGRQVFHAARRPGELLLVDGAGHNDLADVGGERYWRWLTRATTREVPDVTRDVTTKAATK